MGETGILGLTTALTAVAFLTDTVAVLPIIAFPLFAASGGLPFCKIFSKNIWAEKIFQSGPHSSSFSSFRLTGRQGGDAFLGYQCRFVHAWDGNCPWRKSLLP